MLFFFLQLEKTSCWRCSSPLTAAVALTGDRCLTKMFAGAHFWKKKTEHHSRPSSTSKTNPTLRTHKPQQATHNEALISFRLIYDDRDFNSRTRRTSNERTPVVNLPNRANEFNWSRKARDSAAEVGQRSDQEKGRKKTRSLQRRRASARGESSIVVATTTAERSDTANVTVRSWSSSGIFVRSGQYEDVVLFQEILNNFIINQLFMRNEKYFFCFW